MRRSGKLRGPAALLLVLALTLSAALATPTVYGYQEGLAKASENGLWGFADATGRVVIPIQYQSVLDFTLGTALVRSNNKMGLIRQDGLSLIPPEYDTLENLGYGLYLAQKGNQWGVVSMLPFPDEQGGTTQEFFPFVYDAVRTDKVDGLDALVLTAGGADTVVPPSTRNDPQVQRHLPSAPLPLITGRLPSFTDVSPRDWFSVWVDLAYNLNLMQGVGDGRFAPHQTLTVAEALKLAAFLESQASGDTFHLQPVTGTPWYKSSVTYCEASGIISAGEFTDLERPVTRAEMADIGSRTSLARSLPEINSLSRVKAAVPDVRTGDYAAAAIFGLYAKGILTGSDGDLTFRPKDSLTRAEAAAIVSRMARAEQCITLW